MALTKADIKNIRIALKEDFDNLERRIDIKTDQKFAKLIASLPDWSQFATKNDTAAISERLTVVEDVAIGISKRFDQDLIVMQMQLSLHREWLQKHDKQFEQMNIALKRKGSN